MKLWFSVIAASLGTLGALAAACSSSSGASPPETPGSVADAAGTDSTATLDGGADASDSDASDDAPAPRTFVRIAHVSPDLPPIDVCIAPHGTTDFQGPLVGQLAASLAGGDGGAEDASLPGLGYTQVSAYLPVAPGQYDVRLVAAGATDCTAALGTDAATDDAGAGTTDLPALAFDTYATLLIAGDLAPVGGDSPLTLAMLGDDAVLTGGAATLRAINAVPSSGSLDFGLGSPTGAWTAVLDAVPFAQASAQSAPGFGSVDRNGYLSIAPMGGEPMSAWSPATDAGSGVASATSIEIDLGSIATVVAVGGKTGDGANPPALLLCIDNQRSGGLLSDCSLAQ